MAHNFKILDGNWYLSKSGHDSNDGLTPETPKRTITNNMGGKIVFGAGHYTEGILTTSNVNIYPVADGKVILEGLNFGSNYPRGAHDANGLELRGTNITCRQGSVSNLIVKDAQVSSSVTSSSYVNALLIRTHIEDSNYKTINSIFQSILINCTGGPEAIRSSYVDKNSEIRFFYNTFNCTYSNFRGVVLFAGVAFNDGVAKKYCVQDDMVGLPSDHGYAPDVKWLNETNLMADGYLGTDLTLITNNLTTCINKPPLFNAEQIEDFTLQAGSPHIGAGFNGVNIGGTKLAISVTNNNNGMGNLEVIPSPEIDTTNINTYTLKPGFNEGYIDYIQKIGSSPLTLGVISPISTLNFNSDFEGGSLENNTVPDSEPLSSDYPRRFTTTSDALDAQTLMISGHNIQVGEFVRVNGEDREVISATTTNVRVASIFRSVITGGTLVQVGTETGLGALTPNRLTYQLRTSKKEGRPVLLSDWDNDTDPLYSMAGKFLTQEWNTVPGYVIDSNTNKLYGAGNSTAPRGLDLNEISCRWVNLRVFIRNNYNN